MCEMISIGMVNKTQAVSIKINEEQIKTGIEEEMKSINANKKVFECSQVCQAELLAYS